MYTPPAFKILYRPASELYFIMPEALPFPVGRPIRSEEYVWSGTNGDAARAELDRLNAEAVTEEDDPDYVCPACENRGYLEVNDGDTDQLAIMRCDQCWCTARYPESWDDAAAADKAREDGYVLHDDGRLFLVVTDPEGEAPPVPVPPRARVTRSAADWAWLYAQATDDGIRPTLAKRLADQIATALGLLADVTLDLEPDIHGYLRELDPEGFDDAE